MNAAPPARAGFESFVPVLKLQELPTQLWQLEAPLRFYSVELDRWIETPAGFVTDGCSVPRLPVVYLLAGGKAEEAGYMHDCLYTYQTFPRETCDRLLREAVLAMGYDANLAEEMYDAVRMFGQSHWDLPNVTQSASVNAAMSQPSAPVRA